MEVLLPHSLDQALAMKGERPEAIPIAGGTDLMVDLNFGRRRPPAMIDLSRVSVLSGWREENGHVFLGSGLTYAAIIQEMTAFKPLLQASRSVGPTILRATEAEQQLAGAMESAGAWADPSISIPDQVIDEFGDLVGAAAKPLDDVRGTAAYRRHGCRVLARRAIRWALDERRLPAWL